LVGERSSGHDMDVGTGRGRGQAKTGRQGEAMKAFIIVYGTAVLLLMGIAEYRGWSLMSYGEQKGVPKSLRENPGSYRSSYARVLHK
ncbi:MAG: hypothetical protein AMJ94_18265, partial [Deltaproteobacteria bacterium SM23_61]